MHVIAQCFAIGLGFATGLAIVAFALSAVHSRVATDHYKNVLAQYARTEDRLEEYTRHMAVVAEAARWWLAEQAKRKDGDCEQHENRVG